MSKLLHQVTEKQAPVDRLANQDICSGCICIRCNPFGVVCKIKVSDYWSDDLELDRCMRLRTEIKCDGIRLKLNREKVEDVDILIEIIAQVGEINNGCHRGCST